MKVVVLVALFMTNIFAQAVITDSGSTNRPGMTVTVAARGKAEIANREGTAKVKMALDSELQKRFMADVEAAMPLDQLNTHHCMKSVSFGSSTFISYKGVRTPDISCPGQTNPAVIALQKDVEEIMSHARTKMPQGGRQLR